MKVLLRNPRREIDVDDARSVVQLLDRLGLPREAHLVIRNGTLVPGDARLAADDDVGTKASFYLNFLDNMAPMLTARRTQMIDETLGACVRCGSPSTGEVCAFCRLVDTASAHEPVPVELLGKRSRR